MINYRKKIQFMLGLYKIKLPRKHKKVLFSGIWAHLNIKKFHRAQSFYFNALNKLID